MRARPLVLFGSGLLLGLVAMYLVSQRTHWLRFIEPSTPFRAIKTDDLPWKPNAEHRDVVSYEMKPLGFDAHTHTVNLLVHYPKGQMNPWHSHPVGHGMYVLQGTLRTDRGDYKPGTYLWFPPDEVVQHGAGPDEDATVLFLTHEGMTIDYHPHSGH